jgi:FkbM family methyltransferase
MTERIAIHPVGLSNADAVIRTWIKVDGTADASALPLETSKNERAGRIPQELRLVDAVPYCRSQGIAKVDVLKVDCEGCEYALFSNTDLIDFLAPQRIVMEYHRGGGAELFHFLSDRGYRVDWTESETEVGYMYAVRMK